MHRHSSSGGSPFKKERECVLRAYPKLVKERLDTVVLGFPTLISETGAVAMSVSDVKVVKQRGAFAAC